MLNVFLIEPGLQMILHFWAFISKSLSQVIIATLWQLKLLGHDYPEHLLFAGSVEIPLKKSFIQNTARIATICTKQRIPTSTSTCNPTGFGREQDWPDLILHRMQKHFQVWHHRQNILRIRPKAPLAPQHAILNQQGAFNAIGYNDQAFKLSL